MATINKYGDDFYVIERINPVGHRDKDGRILAGSNTLVFAFRRPEDAPHLNVDPVDVLTVLHAQLMNTPAAEHIADAIDALTPPESPVAVPNEQTAGVTPAGGASRKRSKPEPVTV